MPLEWGFLKACAHPRQAMGTYVVLPQQIHAGYHREKKLN